MNKVFVSGFGYTGSGLLIDFLKYSNNTYSIPVEFRILKDVDGLLNLKRLFSNESNYMNSDIALRRFYRFCKVLARKNKVLFGMNTNYYTDNSFMQLVDEFIMEISVDKYWSDAFVFQYHKSDISQIIWKIFRKLRYRISSDTRVIPATEDQFVKSASNFLSKLFVRICQEPNKYLIVDNGVDPWSIRSSQELVGEAKYVIVGRDPRDSYTDLANARDVSCNVDQFIFLFKKMRSAFHETTKDLDYVLYIQFETFLNSFDKEAIKVIEFVKSTSKDNSLDSCLNFRYQPSIHNIGVFKNHHDQSAIRKIEKELNDYCYQ